MFKRDAELQVLMSDFSWTKNVVQFLVSVYNTQLNFDNSISLKKCVLYTENYGSSNLASPNILILPTNCIEAGNISCVAL